MRNRLWPHNATPQTLPSTAARPVSIAIGLTLLKQAILPRNSARKEMGCTKMSRVV